MAKDKYQRFADGSLKPFLPRAEYVMLRDDDRFLYNCGPKPADNQPPAEAIQGEARAREGNSGPLFDAPAFALEVRVAMARENLSLRKLQAITGADQASIHRAAVKELPPSIETYLRLRRWLDTLDKETPNAG